MGIPGFRLTAGLGLACGFAVGAAAQPPARPPVRAAVLLAPRPLAPGDGPAVVRAAANDLPAGPLATTPVTRGGPAWLDAGTDPNLVKAGATTWAKPADAPQRPTNPAAEQSMLSKGLTKLKGLAADQPPAVPFPVPGAAPRQPAPTGPVASGIGQPAAGGQVLAGPPAWRWYGYGSVTPGANPFAQAGQYPRGSANWYAVTGATPGAFPVPVGGPNRMMPGNDPPAYAYQMPQPPTPRGPVVAGPAMSPTPIPVRVTAGPAAPPPVPARPPVGLPTITPPPGLTTAPASPPESTAAKPATPEPPAAAPAPLPVATVPVSAPAPLPPAPPADDVRWQPGAAKPAAPPPAENWSPAGKGK